MSRDVLTVGSTMRILLLYRGEYSQWSERFMNYLEEQMDREAMINCIKHGDQPLPRVTQVSIAGTSSTEQPPLKDKSMWYDQEKKIQKIDNLARSLLIQGFSNDIYSLIDNNKTTKDLWMLLLDICLVLNMKKTVVVTSDPLALIAKKIKVSKRKEKVVVSLDSEGSDADDFSELKKITALLAKAFNRRKFYFKSTNNNLRTSYVSQSANKKQEYVKSDDKKVEKKDDEKKRDMSKVKCYNCKKEGHFTKDCKKAKVKDYEYYKIKILLAKKDKDKQVLLAEDHAWMESSSDSDQKIHTNMVFMAQIKKVLSDLEASSSSADDKISKVSYYLFESESEYEYEILEYYDNTTTYGLFVNDNNDQEIFHKCENFPENLIESQIDHNESAVDHNDYEKIDKLIRKFNKKIAKCLKRIEKANQQNKDFENQNEDLQDKYDVLKNQATTFEMKNNELNEQTKALIEKNDDLLAQANVLKDQLQVKHVVIDTHVECQEKYAKLEAERYEYMIRYSAYFDNEKQHRKQIADQEVLYDKMSVQLVELDKHVRDLKNKTVHMIMPLKDNLYNGRNGIGFENPSYFEKSKDLRPSLYDEKVIGLGYTPMFLTLLDEALEIEKFKRARENKIEFAYDYGNLNASYVNEKISFLDDYFQEIINPDFEKIDSSFQQKSSLKPYVPTVILEKVITDLEDEVVSLLAKEKANLETIESLKSKGFESSENAISESKNQSENDCQVVKKCCDQVENSNVIAPGMFKLSVSQSVSPISVTKTSYASNSVENTFSSVRRPKPSGVMWMKKGSSNTVKVDFAFDCKNVRNALCNARMNASVNVNDLFVFDDVSIRKSHVSKMPFRKKPSASLNVPSRSKLNKFLPRIMRKWLPKLKTLAEPVAKWIPRVARNHALLINFVEKFLGTVRFGNFAVIAGYGDVVIGSMTIKKFYFVEGLGHDLFNVGQFCDKGLEVTFRKSKCFVRTEDGVDLLIGDRSSNLYTIALNEVASNSLACLLAKASSSQSWLWHQRLSHSNFATINNLVKNNLVQGLPKMKFEKDHLCFACEQEKIHQKHHKSKTDFALNKPLYLLHTNLCRPMHVKSINRKRYVLVFVDDYSWYTCVFFLHSKDEAFELKAKGDIGVFVGYSKESASFRIYNNRTRKIYESVNVNFDEISEMDSKQFSLEPSLSNLNEMGKSSNQSASQVSETSKKDLEDLFQKIYDEYFDSSKIMKSSTTNVETSNVNIPSNEEEVFHESYESFQEESSSSSLNDYVQQSLEEVEDAYFDASTLFHDPSNVHIFYQPYPHEKKWTKDHPLYKIIGDSKSSVRTRSQLANSCLFSCLLSSTELANVAEALKDVDWASAMQDGLINLQD
nr:ribonuclease H-like domain-containing protein [Tanacetum cinerariifolium]